MRHPPGRLDFRLAMTEPNAPEPTEDALEEFQRGLHSQGIRRLPSMTLPNDLLTRGVAHLEHAHRLDAHVELGERPAIFYRVPENVSASDLEGDQFMLAPYGWEMDFGSALTLSLLSRGSRWLGRAVIPRAALVPAFDQAQVDCVLVRKNVPIARLVIDFASKEASARLYRDNLDKVRTHEAVVLDDVALFWEVTRHMKAVVERFGLRPSDLLSLGWIEVYSHALNRVARIVQEIKLLPTLAAPSDAPKHYVRLAHLLRRSPELSISDLLGAVAATYAESHADFIDLRSQSWHDLAHELAGDHSALCMLAPAVADLYLTSSDVTKSGTRLAKLDGCDRIKHHEIHPDSFPESCAPDDYWRRVLSPLVEWGVAVRANDFPADLAPSSTLWSTMPRAEDVESVRTSARSLLEEAVAERKWTIPPDALLELPYGPFSEMQLTESKGTFEFVLRTRLGEVSCGALNPHDSSMWWEALHGLPEAMEHAGCADALYLLICATVRDFLVVEERERVFAQETKAKPWTRSGRNDPGTPRVVYLPRVRYVANPDLTQCRQNLGHVHTELRAHPVRPHLRRCHSPSTEQLFLAQRYGMEVPQGFTFVRPHDRGKAARDTIYRSRSALQCLYEVQGKNPPNQRRNAWFDFERDVHQMMAGLGFIVQHIGASGRGDRGVDVYATKGVDLELVSWVIQCKCYDKARKIGPNLIRELVGTLAEYPRGTRGMLVTTSAFSREARALAERHDVRLIDGTEFIARVRD
jgi:hypothetical protein